MRGGQLDVPELDWIACETLFEGGKNADVGVGVALVLRACAVIAEERFNAVGEFGCLLPIDMND
jgi:hypothetical protein